MKDYAKYDALGLAELVRTGQVKGRGNTWRQRLPAPRQRKKTSIVLPISFRTLRANKSQADFLSGPLMGAPFPTKDLAVGIKGAPLTNGSRGWKDYVAER